MSTKIIKAGLAASLQSAARLGYRHAGISTGGPMDDFAFFVAACLAGNDEMAAAIEINFPAPEMLFENDAIIAITGADFSPFINNQPVTMYKPVLVRAGEILKFEKPVWGSKAYIAVHKGWQAATWLGSRSTHIKAAAGGHYGRMLQKNDQLAFESLPPGMEEIKNFSWQIAAPVHDLYQPPGIIRCTAAPEWGWLSSASQSDFEKMVFTLSHQNDRMGYRFTGGTLQKNNEAELVSVPVDSGTMQLLPDGNIIVLMADCQTTGGYPRIASVLKADLPRLAQLRANERIQYKIVSPGDAENEMERHQKIKQGIRNGCMFHYKKVTLADRH